MKNALTILILMLTFAGFSATIYIDPTYKGTTQNGTAENPYDSWTDFTIQSGNTYLQKVNTTYTSTANILISGKNGVTLGSYGSGVRPVFQYKGTGQAIKIENSDNTIVNNYEINGNTSAHSLVGVYGSASRYLNNIIIENCRLTNSHNTNNAGFGVHGFYVNGLKVQFTYIWNVALDGMYLRYCINADIGYCIIYEINRRYFTQPNESLSSGDGIQFDGNYNGFYLHHTRVARNNGAGNKFNVIFNSGAGISDNATGVIEYCEFETDGTVSTAVHIERGNGIIVRYNTFLGTTQGIRIAGRYSNNTLIYGNEFINCDRGIGVGANYISGVAYPAVGTWVYDNTFANTTRYQVWIDKARVTVCNNTGDGIPVFNYGGGSWVTNCND